MPSASTENASGLTMGHRKPHSLSMGFFPRLPMTPPDPSEPAISNAHSPSSSSVLSALQVLSSERAALAHLEHLYHTDALAQEHLVRAVSQIARSIRAGGKLVCCGVGKSGKIAQKLEATMNSLAVHSAFLHPTEALHGDLGMIRPNDTLLLISFSGRTAELLLLLPHIPPTVPVIAITAHMHPSTCPLLSFQPSDMGILLPAPIHEDEEVSIGVSAPTSSTTVALALGDALAIATARQLHPSPAEVFRSFHPGGAIGAASTASTPVSMSMSTASFPSDDMVSSAAATQTTIVSEPVPRLCDLIVPLDEIPTVTTSASASAYTTSSTATNHPIRLLDILLTAIQHPTAHSWVLLSPSDIIPPRHLRALSQGSYIDMDVSAYSNLGLPCAVPRKEWLFLPSSCTLEYARRRVSASATPVKVVAAMDPADTNTCVGVLEAADLWSNHDPSRAV